MGKSSKNSLFAVRLTVRIVLVVAVVVVEVVGVTGLVGVEAVVVGVGVVVGVFVVAVVIVDVLAEENVGPAVELQPSTLEGQSQRGMSGLKMRSSSQCSRMPFPFVELISI